MLTFGDSKLPDIHTFRIEHGKIRYVHTITVCKTFNCGFKLPEALQAPGPRRLRRAARGRVAQSWFTPINSIPKAPGKALSV